MDRREREKEEGDSTENCDPSAATGTLTASPPPGEAVVVDHHMAGLQNQSKALIEELEDEPMLEAMDTGGAPQGDQVDFKVIFNKNKLDIVFGWERTIKELKAHLEGLIGVAQNAQKILIKGMPKDEMTLRQAGVTPGGKVMVVGSKMNDILAVTNCKQQVLIEEKTASASNTKEPLCEQKLHRKVLDKGIPPDVMPGIKDCKEPLPPVPLSGMLNKHGGKVRLTFKLELDQLWLSTKERTEKLGLSSIKGVTSEAIKDHEQYHIVGLQLGPTEASRYWVYWVPAQYVEAIKDAILGKWQVY